MRGRRAVHNSFFFQKKIKKKASKIVEQRVGEGTVHAVSTVRSFFFKFPAHEDSEKNDLRMGMGCQSGRVGHWPALGAGRAHIQPNLCDSILSGARRAEPERSRPTCGREPNGENLFLWLGHISLALHREKKAWCFRARLSGSRERILFFFSAAAAIGRSLVEQESFGSPQTRLRGNRRWSVWPVRGALSSLG